MIAGGRLIDRPTDVGAVCAEWENEGGAIRRPEEGSRDDSKELAMLGTVLTVFGDLPADMRLRLFADLYLSLQSVRA
jgi:hypothetical protein